MYNIVWRDEFFFDSKVSEKWAKWISYYFKKNCLLRKNHNACFKKDTCSENDPLYIITGGIKN